MPTSYSDVSTVVGGITYDATSLSINNSVPNSTFNRLGQRGLFQADAPVDGSLSLSSFLTDASEFSTFLSDKRITASTSAGGATSYLSSLSIEGDPTSPVTLNLEFQGAAMAISTTTPSTAAIAPALGVLTEVSGDAAGGKNFTFSYSLTKSYGKSLFKGTSVYEYHLEGVEEKLTIEGESAASLSSPCPATMTIGLNFSSCGGAIGGVSIISGKVIEYSSEVQAGDILKNTISIVNTF